MTTWPEPSRRQESRRAGRGTIRSRSDENLLHPAGRRPAGVNSWTSWRAKRLRDPRPGWTIGGEEWLGKIPPRHPRPVGHLQVRVRCHRPLLRPGGRSVSCGESAPPSVLDDSRPRLTRLWTNGVTSSSPDSSRQATQRARCGWPGSPVNGPSGVPQLGRPPGVLSESFRRWPPRPDDHPPMSMDFGGSAWPNSYQLMS